MNRDRPTVRLRRAGCDATIAVPDDVAADPVALAALVVGYFAEVMPGWSINRESIGWEVTTDRPIEQPDDRLVRTWCDATPPAPKDPA